MQEVMFLNIAGVIVKLESKEFISALDRLDKEGCITFSGYKDFILLEKPKKYDFGLKVFVRPKIKSGMPFIRSMRSKVLKRQDVAFQKRQHRWHVSRKGKKIILAGPSFMNSRIILEKDLKKCSLLVIKPNDFFYLMKRVNDTLRILLSYYIGYKKLGLMVHSAGLEDGKNGYLFAGESGAGKTTMGRIWSGSPKVKILSDEIVIIRKSAKSFYVCPTPWYSFCSESTKNLSTKKSRLKMIFCIYHRKKNKMELIPTRERLKSFFSTIFFFSWDKKCVKNTLAFLNELLTYVPTYKLGFVKQKTIVNYIRTKNRRHRTQCD